MQKMKRLKNILCKIITISLVLLLGGIITTSLNKNKQSAEDVILADAWSSSLASSVKFNNTDPNVYVDIDKLYEVNNGICTTVENYQNLLPTNSIIKINNGLDLYYFSELCNTYDAFLGYDYVLGQDIEYTDASKTFKLIKPIGWGASPFRGTFDGQGFTISDLFFYHIIDETDYVNNFVDPETGDYLEYMALFSKNTGTIKNVGFINSNNIQSTDTFGDFFFLTTSIVVGLNRGTVDHVYVQDLRGDSAGITVEGSSTFTAPLAGMNTAIATNDVATISNCYVAVNYISSTSVILSDESRMYAFIVNNSEENHLVNCYYDTDIILHDTHMNVPGVTALTTAQFQDLTLFSTTNNWYSNATYTTGSGSNSYATYLQLKYPSLLGFEVRDHNSKKNFVIDTASKFIYFSTVIKYAPFRTASYLITETIDMSQVAPESFALTNNIFQGTIDGSVKDGANSSQIIFADGRTSNNSSIINFKLTKGISYIGYHNYGLFGALGGTIKNLNIYNAEITPLDLADYTASSFNEITSIGILCGTLINGTIDNVHVNGKITLDSGGNNNYIGTVYTGGITGYSSSGTINNSTSSGQIIGSTQVVTNNLTDVAIGGIIGYNNLCQRISNCLSSMDIEAIRYDTKPNIKQYLGGVIGYAKSKSSYELQNNGNIYVGVTLQNKTYSSSTLNYGTVYVGGIIGLIQQANVSNGSYFNNGDIYYYVNNTNYEAYISGVMNAINEIAMQYNKLTSTERYEDINDMINSAAEFDFVSIGSGGTLHIENQLSTSKHSAKLYQMSTSYANGIDIRAAGLVYSYLTKIDFVGLYTLNYKLSYTYKCVNAGTYNGTSYTAGKVIEMDEYLTLSPSEMLQFRLNETVKTSNGAQEIDVSMLDEYAPCINSDNQVTYKNYKLYVETNQIPQNSTTFSVEDDRLETTVNVNRGYNFRRISYITNKEVLFYTLQLSGNLNGRNFNVNNLRTEGDIFIYFTHPANTAISQHVGYYGDSKKLKVFGCMEEINLDHRATNVYNGSDIYISSVPTYQFDDGIETLQIAFNIYAGGLCYKNVGNDDSITDEGLMLSSGYVGSLHNSINNGNIVIQSGEIIKYEDITDSNYIIPSANFYGQSRIGGITCFNCSTISSCYNLGDIRNINYIRASKSPSRSELGVFDGDDFEVETGGFCFIMQNDPLSTDGSSYTRANIIDSANNGTIISATASTLGWINASGFVVRNERCESGPTIDSKSLLNINANQQKIENCINYGDIYAYNPNTGNAATSASEPDCKSAGFLCLGACSIIDIINYGKVYSSKVAGGMYGYIYFSRMINGSDIETDHPIYIANAINYGEIAIFTANTSNLNYLQKNTPSLIANANANITTYPIGALIGMATSTSNSSYPYSKVLGCLNIKNLVNFYDNINMVGRTNGFYNSTSAANYVAMYKTMQYMATTADADTCPNTPFSSFTITTAQSYGGVTIQPGTYGIKCYSKDAAVGDSSVSNVLSKAYNGGIFNADYTLRTAPPLVDANGVIVTDPALADPNNTDNYIADYIQFVPYSKVNDYLVDKINLSGTIYQNAVNILLNDVESLDKILSAYLVDLNDTTDPTISSIYTEVLRQGTFTTAKNATFSDSYARLYTIMQGLLANHQDDQTLYTLLNSMLTEQNYSINDLFGNEESLYILVNSALQNVASNNSSYDRLMTTLISNEEYFASYIEYIGYDEMLNIISNYIARLSATEITDLFDTLNNNTYISELIHETSLDDHQTLMTTLLQNVDATVINDLYNQVDRTSDAYINGVIDGLTETNLNSLLTYYLTNSASTVTDTIVNNNKTNYQLTNTSMQEILVQYYLNNTTTFTSLFNSLTDDQKVGLYNYIFNLANSTASDNQVYKDLYNHLMTAQEAGGYVYILSDSVSFNSSSVTGKGRELDAVRMTTSDTGYTSTGYIYTGYYSDYDGTLAARTYSGYYQAVFTYVSQTYSTKYYNYNYLDNNGNEIVTLRASSSTSTGNEPYFTVSASTNTNTRTSCVYYSRSGSGTNRVYTLRGYGKYVRLTEQSNYNTVSILGSISEEAKKDLMERFFDSYLNSNVNVNQRAFIGTFVKYCNDGVSSLNSKTLLNNITLTKALLNTSLNSTPYLFANQTVFTITDKRNILYYLANANTTSKQYVLTNYVSGGVSQTDAIINYAYNNAAYYKTILDTIGDDLTDTEKIAYIEEVAYYSITAEQEIFSNILVNYSDDDQKQAVIGTASYNLNYLAHVLKELNNNGESLLENSDVDLFLNGIFENDNTTLEDMINYLHGKDYPNDTLLNVEDKKLLIAQYGAHDTTLFKFIMKDYFGIDFNGTNYKDLIDTVARDANIDASQFTDFVGIYALASSYGIKNGMFIPDNISLIGLDPYSTINGELVNDPTWRGGSISSPNAYDMNDTSTVNYRVYYMMKQLKKSISTVVFKIELVDDVNNVTYTVNNNNEDDYDLENFIIDFYIPSNADELMQDYLYINTNPSRYELAYLATFKTNPGIYINGSNHTYSIGDTIEETFVVQAEDTNVTQQYTIRINVTAPKSINSLGPIVVNGTTTLTNTQFTNNNNNVILTYNNNIGPYVSAENGSIRVEYNTYNYQDGLDLSSNLKLYSYTGTYPSNFTNIMDSCVLVDSSLYDLTNTTNNNGIVVMENNAYYYINPGNPLDGCWVVNDNGTIRQAVGTLIFDVHCNNELPYGTYVLEFTLNSRTKYLTVFQKEANRNAKVVNVSFGESSFDNVSRLANNSLNPLLIEYGYPMTREMLIAFESPFEIEISPLAQGYILGNPTYTRNGNYITYQLPITITAESGDIETFILYIQEANVTGALVTAYENGRVVEDQVTDTGTSYFDYSFVKYDTPSYTIEYDMSNFHFLDSSAYMHIELSDASATTIINNLSTRDINELNEVAFMGMAQTDINALSASAKLALQINALKEMSFVTSTIEGSSVTVSFTENAPSTTYIFDVYYTNDSDFNTTEHTDNIVWNYQLEGISITKEKNTDSYLEAIAFTSDSVVTSLDTIASPTEIAAFAEGYTSVTNYVDYNTLVRNANNEREIICLPSRIFYNQYAQDINKQQKIHVIGLVDKTAISEYSPVFQLPEDSEIYLLTTVDGVVYKNVLYEYTTVVDGVNTVNQAIILINEAGTSARLIDTNYTEIATSTTNLNTFEYNGNTYTLSSYAGTNSTLNLALYYDFSNMREESSTTGIQEFFNYADYRVYSEAYDANNVNVAHYTDFLIAVQDISNNVLINVYIDLDSNMASSDINTFNERISTSYLYFLLTNFLATDENPNVYDQFNNMMGSFVTYDGVNDVFTISKFRTNTSGRYEIDFELPDGYSFTFIAKKKNNVISSGNAEDSMIVGNMITSQIIDLYITVIKEEDRSDDWGQHHESIITTDPTI